jgi:hypothetical protein
MSKTRDTLVAASVSLGLATFYFTSLPWAEELPPPSSADAFPEGSSSVIESRSWQWTGQDSVIARDHVKEVIGRIAGAVIVKEAVDELVISVPTSALSILRQSLMNLGSLSGTEAESIPRAPTTLLRLRFVPP